MIRNITLCLFVLTLTFSSLFAQWPTTPMVGIQLTNDPDHYEYIKAYCQDGKGGYYVCIENEGRLYINHIDLYGNIRWPIDYPPEECFTDQDPGWLYAGPKRETVVMACNSEGIVWVAWEDFRDSWWDEDYYPTSSDLYIQKFDQDRVAQWNPETGLLIQAHVDRRMGNYVHDWRMPRHLEPQDDGNIIIMWTDQHQPTVPYEGNEWAQRFDPDGNPVWDIPGVRTIPNDTWGDNWTSKLYHSDGIGGVLFTYKNIPLRLLPTGELAWPFGEVEIAEMYGPRDICAGYDNTIAIIGDGRRQNNEDHLCYATVVDTSGNFVHGPTTIGNPEHEFSGSYIGKTGCSSFSLLGLHNRNLTYYSIDSSLNNVLEPTVIDTHPIIRPVDETLTISKVGYRMVSMRQGGYADSHMEVFGYDTLGVNLFEYSLEEDSSNAWRPRLDVDQSGNTWVFWTKLEPSDDVYLNIISPTGEWGLVSDGVGSPGSSTLPENISLHVYPNPGNGQFNVSFDLVDPSPATFIVTNVLGQSIWIYEQSAETRMTSLRSTLPLNLKDQASGTYFIQVRTESGLVHQRRILLVK